MLGALAAGLVYAKTKKLLATMAGEVLGTGLLGGVAAYFMATLVMNRQAAFFAYVLPFAVSSAGGAVIAGIIVAALKRTMGDRF